MSKSPFVYEQTSSISAEDWERRLNTEDVGIFVSTYEYQDLMDRALENTDDPEIQELIEGIYSAIGASDHSAAFGNHGVGLKKSLVRILVNRAYPEYKPEAAPDPVLSIVPDLSPDFTASMPLPERMVPLIGQLAATGTE